MAHEQLDLFANPPRQHGTQEQFVMDADALVKWMSRIFDYQQHVRESKPPQQTTLFNFTPTHCEIDSIDLFNINKT